jgi:endoglucanase
VTIPALAANAGPRSQSLQACAQAANSEHVPESGSEALSRGVNITTLFGTRDASSDLTDIPALKRIGIKHIRLPIDPDWVLSWPTGGSVGDKLRRLDDAVCAALSVGLAVILDNHGGSLKPKDTSNEIQLSRLGAAWDRLAARYAVFTPELMFFEALNEPAFTEGKRWERWQRELLTHIRAVAPNHTVLLTASPDSTAAGLARLDPVEDKNVVYVFHFYSPMLFTHQGAEWAEPSYESIRGLKYPPDSQNVDQVKSRASKSYRPALTAYLADFAHGRAISSEIQIASDWAQLHHVRLIVTEFGVYDSVVPPRSRVAWLSDVRQRLEARSIGWTVWELRGGFGVASDLQIPCNQPLSMKAALGLCSAE